MLTKRWLPQALGAWLTAVESITTEQRSSVQEWYWVMMGMPRLTRLEVGVSLSCMRLMLLTRLTQLTSLSLNAGSDDPEDDKLVNPKALCPLSALQQLRELKVVNSSVPQIPPGVSNLSNLLYLEFHTVCTPHSVVLPSVTQLTQLQALVLRSRAVDMRSLTLDSGLTHLVNLQVLMVNSQMVRGHVLTNSFAAFSMSGLQVLDLSLRDSSRFSIHWLASMHQLRVLVLCSSALTEALPAQIMPLLKVLIISADRADGLPCTQPVLHVDTLPSVLNRMKSPHPLTVVCRSRLVMGKLPAAQVRSLSSTGSFLVISKRVPVRHIHQLVLNNHVCRLAPSLKQLCHQLPHLTIPCFVY